MFKPIGNDARIRAGTYPNQSSIPDSPKTNDRDADQHYNENLEMELQRLNKELAQKENMLQTSGMLGNQLIQENDHLQSQIEDLNNEITLKDKMIIEKERDIVIMSDRVAETQSQIIDLQDKNIAANHEIDRLKDELTMLEKLNSPDESNAKFDQNTPQRNADLEKLRNAYNVVEKAYREEQRKSQSLLVKAEQTAKRNTLLEKSITDLQNQHKWLSEEKSMIESKYASEIDRLKQRILTVENHNSELIAQLSEQQDFLDSAQDELEKLRRKSNDARHSVQFRVQRQSSTTTDEGISNDHDHNINELQFFSLNEIADENENHSDINNTDINHSLCESIVESPTSNQKNLSIVTEITKMDTLQHDDQTNGINSTKNDNNVVDNEKKTNEKNNFKNTTSTTPSIQFDAMQEYIGLSILAAKLKYKDVAISSKQIRQRLNKEKVEFHEIADWLNDYMTNQRLLQETKKHSDNAKNQQMSEENKLSTKHFLQRLFWRGTEFAKEATNFGTVRLEVRYKKRIFEIKMKRNDKLFLILETLPPVIGKTADEMTLVRDVTILDVEGTMQTNNLKPDDTIRMLESEKVQQYMNRLKKLKAKSSVAESFKII